MPAIPLRALPPSAAAPPLRSSGFGGSTRSPGALTTLLQTNDAALTSGGVDRPTFGARRSTHESLPGFAGPDRPRAAAGAPVPRLERLPGGRSRGSGAG